MGFNNHSLNCKTKETVDNRNWLSTSQAAIHLGITTQALLNMVSAGRIPYYKLGRRNRYLQKDLDDEILKNRRGPGGY